MLPSEGSGVDGRFVFSISNTTFNSNSQVSSSSSISTIVSTGSSASHDISFPITTSIGLEFSLYPDGDLVSTSVYLP